MLALADSHTLANNCTYREVRTGDGRWEIVTLQKWCPFRGFLNEYAGWRQGGMYGPLPIDPAPYEFLGGIFSDNR